MNIASLSAQVAQLALNHAGGTDSPATQGKLNLSEILAGGKLSSSADPDGDWCPTGRIKIHFPPPPPPPLGELGQLAQQLAQQAAR